MRAGSFFYARKAFTLIELLVVIAIIAVISIVVVTVLNPTQLLKQSRDSGRISDLSEMNAALGYYLSQGGSSLGNSSVAYISIPDPTATSTAGDQCQGLGLPSLSHGYTYQCAASSTFRAIDGTGWVPINFTKLPDGTPFSELPVDPINTTSSGLFYTYETNGSQYEFTAATESQKYSDGGTNDVESTDGGLYPDLYEKGTILSLAPIDFYSASQPGVFTLNASEAISGSATSTLAFSGTAGEVVNLVPTNNTYPGCNGAAYGILNPNGSTLASGWSDDSGCNGTKIENETLPTTGTYTIYLYPGNASGSVTLTLSQNQTGAIAMNSSNPLSNTLPGQNIDLTFSGTAGQVVNLAPTNNTYPGCNGAEYGILNPSGSTLASGWSDDSGCNGTKIENETLPTTGTYTAFVYSVGATGTLMLTLSQNQTGTIAMNSSNPLSNTLPGQNIDLTFSGTAGQVVNLAPTSSTYPGCAGAEYGILNPSGGTVASGWSDDSGCDGTKIENQTLATSGTYTAFIYSVGASGTLTFTLSQNQTGTIAVNSTTSVSNTLPGQNTNLTFSGTSGEVVSLTPSSNTYPGCAGAEYGIQTPTGTTQASQWTALWCGGGLITSSTLSSNGTYTVFVYSLGYSGAVMLRLNM